MPEEAANSISAPAAMRLILIVLRRSWRGISFVIGLQGVALRDRPRPIWIWYENRMEV